MGCELSRISLEPIWNLSSRFSTWQAREQIAPERSQEEDKDVDLSGETISLDLDHDSGSLKDFVIKFLLDIGSQLRTRPLEGHRLIMFQLCVCRDLVGMPCAYC